MSAAKKKRAQKAKGPTFLVGDIGGTNTRLAIFDAEGRSPLFEAVLASRDHATFDEAAELFLAEAGGPTPDVAAFAVAAPITKGTAAFTNLPWRIDERALARRLGIGKVVLLNDLVASARGCLLVPPSSLVALTEARPSRRGQNLAVIAAGTGLGEARLVWTGSEHIALPTEGGHCDFAPRNALEVELLQFLWGRYPDHVSYERVVSGMGIGNLYDFFAARSGAVPASIAGRLAGEDRNAVITELGLAREHLPAERAVDLFASIYGAEAGNLALGELALGGVYVTGKIAHLILPARREIFLEAFRAKGRFTELLSRVPVAVVTDPLVNRRGALAVARETAI
ncbi:MAG: glucokinase [Byssovorax sp.]